MKLLMENWRKYLNEEKLRVFDFDDTLAVTDSKIILHKADGETIEQTPGEWAIYIPQQGDKFDFAQFRGDLINPREIKKNMDIFRKVLAAGSEGRKTVILTARSDDAREGILKFLKDMEINLSNLELVTLNSSDPQDKAKWIEQRIEEGYDDIVFLDDSYKNIAAVAALEKKYPVELEARLV